MPLILRLQIEMGIRVLRQKLCTETCNPVHAKRDTCEPLGYTQSQRVFKRRRAIVNKSEGPLKDGEPEMFERIGYEIGAELMETMAHT